MAAKNNQDLVELAIKVANEYIRIHDPRAVVFAVDADRVRGLLTGIFEALGPYLRDDREFTLCDEHRIAQQVSCQACCHSKSPGMNGKEICEESD